MTSVHPIPNSSQSSTVVLVPTIECADWHRSLACYLANGMDHEQCAQMCEINVDMVGKLLQKEWFQKLVAEALDIRKKDVGELFKGAAIRAFAALISVVNDPKAAAAAKIKAAEIIINRNLGAVPQTVNYTRDSKIADPIAEEAKLERQLAALRETTPSEDVEV